MDHREEWGLKLVALSGRTSVKGGAIAVLPLEKLQGSRRGGLFEEGRRRRPSSMRNNRKN